MKINKERHPTILLGCRSYPNNLKTSKKGTLNTFTPWKKNKDNLPAAYLSSY